jgi:hypothetical protein
MAEMAEMLKNGMTGGMGMPNMSMFPNYISSIKTEYEEDIKRTYNIGFLMGASIFKLNRISVISKNEKIKEVISLILSDIRKLNEIIISNNIPSFAIFTFNMPSRESYINQEKNMFDIGSILGMIKCKLRSAEKDIKTKDTGFFDTIRGILLDIENIESLICIPVIRKEEDQDKKNMW